MRERGESGERGERGEREREEIGYDERKDGRREMFWISTLYTRKNLMAPN